MFISPSIVVLVREQIKRPKAAILVTNTLTLIALKYLYKPWGPKGCFQFKIVINVLVGSFHFI